MVQETCAPNLFTYFDVRTFCREKFDISTNIAYFRVPTKNFNAIKINAGMKKLLGNL